jgi:topoisomerase-4 subunit A
MALEEQVECTGRPRRGVQVLRELKTKPHHIVGFERVQPKDQLTLLTSKGKLFTVSAAAIRLSDRYSNGSFVLDQEEDGTVSEVWKEVASED